MSKKPRLAIVVAKFHQEVANRLIQVAEKEIKAQGAVMVTLTRVAGSYEMPLIVDRLLRRNNIDGAAVLGFIERGQTLHGEIMGQVVSAALIQIQLKYGKPIGMGIIGPGATTRQAQQRVLATARGAVRAAIQTYRLLHSGT